MKSKRGWFEPLEESGSSYKVEIGSEVYDRDNLTLTLTDCDRRITWYFGKPGSKRGVRKIKKIKKLVDEIYEHIVPEKKR